MPIETDKLNVLSDITFEAQLLLRSKFIKKIKLGFEDFKNLPKLAEDKEVLLTTTLDGKRFIIYLSHGKIVSSAMVDTSSGTRQVGLKPLATLIAASKISPITFKLYEVQPMVSEDRTREASIRPSLLEKGSRKRSGPIEVKAVPEVRPVPIPKEEKEGQPIILEFTRRIKEFMDKMKEDVSDLAGYYGCKFLDLKIEISRGVLKIKIYVKKKGLFTKCRTEDLKKAVENDADILLTMLDLDTPCEVYVIERKK
ncbi:MAG: hypothetical protein GXO43_00190 [Crenarchaeota archaeon]|nr:hypothetical protein [Thermoproteota archaeon]